MSISLLVLELLQFSFIRDKPKIQKLEIPLSGFCPISENWGEFEIPNLAQMFLMKYYWMVQNVRVTVFTVSELLRENGINSWKCTLKITKIVLELRAGFDMIPDYENAIRGGITKANWNYGETINKNTQD